MVLHLRRNFGAFARVAERAEDARLSHLVAELLVLR